MCMQYYSNLPNNLCLFIPAGPAFDDDLWKLRQEVNRLKETLAMQSAYIQSMPKPLGTVGTQASSGVGPAQVRTYSIKQ